MNELMIIDASALVHTGHKAPRYKDFTFYNYPVGGIRYLMTYVTEALVLRNTPVLCFDSPSFRNTLQEGYKSGRTKDYAVISQLETLYEELSRCGISCFKEKGFEADDIIDWVAQRFSNDFHATTIIGNDMDLAHSVTTKVRFQSICSSNAVSVNASNFSTAVERGETVPFNTISAFKVFYGCKSDKIPAFKSSLYTSAQLFEGYVNFLQEAGLIGQNISSQRKWIEFYIVNIDLPANEVEQLQARIKLVYPADPPEDWNPTITLCNKINKDALASFLTKYNAIDSLKSLKLTKLPLSESSIEDLRNKARTLSTGAFAADRGIKKEFKPTASKMLDLDSFSRDF